MTIPMTIPIPDNHLFTKDTILGKPGTFGAVYRFTGPPEVAVKIIHARGVAEYMEEFRKPDGELDLDPHRDKIENFMSTHGITEGAYSGILSIVSTGIGGEKQVLNDINRDKNKLNYGIESGLVPKVYTTTGGSNLRYELPGRWRPLTLKTHEGIIAMEVIKGRDLSASAGRGTRTQCIFYIAQACAALAYVQACGYIHGDIKLENTMVRTPGWQLVLVDYGGTIRQTDEPVPRGRDATHDNSYTCCNTHYNGTLASMSPEMARNDGWRHYRRGMLWERFDEGRIRVGEASVPHKPPEGRGWTSRGDGSAWRKKDDRRLYTNSSGNGVGYASDWWGIGVMAYEIFTGDTYSSVLGGIGISILTDSTDVVLRRLGELEHKDQGRIDELIDTNDSIPKECKGFIKGLLKIDCEQRLCAVMKPMAPGSKEGPTLNWMEASQTDFKTAFLNNFRLENPSFVKPEIPPDPSVEGGLEWKTGILWNLWEALHPSRNAHFAKGETVWIWSTTAAKWFKGNVEAVIDNHVGGKKVVWNPQVNVSYVTPSGDKRGKNVEANNRAQIRPVNQLDGDHPVGCEQHDPEGQANPATSFVKQMIGYELSPTDFWNRVCCQKSVIVNLHSICESVQYYSVDVRTFSGNESPDLRFFRYSKFAEFYEEFLKRYPEAKGRVNQSQYYAKKWWNKNSLVITESRAKDFSNILSYIATFYPEKFAEVLGVGNVEIVFSSGELGLTMSRVNIAGKQRFSIDAITDESDMMTEAVEKGLRAGMILTGVNDVGDLEETHPTLPHPLDEVIDALAVGETLTYEEIGKLSGNPTVPLKLEFQMPASASGEDPLFAHILSERPFLKTEPGPADQRGGYYTKKRKTKKKRKKIRKKIHKKTNRKKTKRKKPKKSKKPKKTKKKSKRKK